MLTYQIPFLIMLLIFSGFFSGVETALMSIGHIKTKSLLNQKKRGSVALYRIKQNPRRLIITILIGNNIVNISSATLAAVVFTTLLGSSGVGIATGVMTFLILVFGEITPKTYATQHAEKISLAVARPIEFLTLFLWPLVKFFELISFAISKLLHSVDFQEEITEEDLRTIVVMGAKQRLLQKQAVGMIHNLLNFKDISIAVIMTPKRDIKAVKGTDKLKDVINFVVKNKYTQYPVYIRGKLTGIINIDDILKFAKGKSLEVSVSKLTRSAEYVNEVDKANTLLKEWEGKANPIALVLNKQKAVVGLITSEDVIESIVGEIFDKTKRHKHILIKRINSKYIAVGAKASVQEVSNILHLGIRDKHFETLAKFVEGRLDKVKKGATLQIGRIKLEISKVLNGRIRTIRITKK